MNCEGCKFWKRLPDAAQVTSEPLRGQCHRFPPYGHRDAENSNKVYTTWPITFAGESCGEFKKLS